MLASSHSTDYTLDRVGTLRPSTRDWLIRTHLLSGEWWHAASLIAATHTLQAYKQTQPTYRAWLRGIPVSEAHASKLIQAFDAGLASPALSLRQAYEKAKA